jgi:hypothetical protein
MIDITAANRGNNPFHYNTAGRADNILFFGVDKKCGILLVENVLYYPVIADGRAGKIRARASATTGFDRIFAVLIESP